MGIFSAFLALWGRGSPYSASLALFCRPFRRAESLRPPFPHFLTQRTFCKQSKERARLLFSEMRSWMLGRRLPCSDKISGTHFPSFTVFSGTYPHFTNDKKKRKAPRGKGDPFRTAPEISALFSDHCFLPAQKRMEKAVPLSNSLSTESRQPARRHSFLTMASPSPNPPPAPLCDLSTV